MFFKILSSQSPTRTISPKRKQPDYDVIPEDHPILADGLLSERCRAHLLGTVQDLKKEHMENVSGIVSGTYGAQRILNRAKPLSLIHCFVIALVGVPNGFQMKFKEGSWNSLWAPLKNRLDFLIDLVDKLDENFIVDCHAFRSQDKWSLAHFSLPYLSSIEYFLGDQFSDKWGQMPQGGDTRKDLLARLYALQHKVYPILRPLAHKMDLFGHKPEYYISLVKSSRVPSPSPDHLVW